MNRTEKQALIDDLHQEFGRSPHAILVDFRGLSVPAVTEFRRKVKAAGSRYRVVKNTLALRAAKGTPLEKLGPQFDNTTGVAYTGTDPVALAKTLIDFAKDHPQLVVKGGLVSGSQMLDAAGLALSTLSMIALALSSSFSGPNDTLPIGACTMAVLSTRYSTFPALISFTALPTSKVTVPVFGFGIRPRGPRTFPSLPTDRIMSGVATMAPKSSQFSLWMRVTMSSPPT